MPEALVAASSALLPDLDTRQSYFGRLIKPVSGWFEDTFGHRTLTHSLFAQVTMGVLAYFVLPFGFFLAFRTGWVSHTFADMMTPSGVCWFWPNRARCVIPGNSRYRMEVMGKGELWFLVIMGLMGVLLMPLAATGKNTTGLIRSAIGDIATARKDYDAKKGEHAFYLEVKGRDNRSYADVSGRYYVIGAFQESGFLLETDQGARSACKASACDWYADYGALQQGDAEMTTTIPVEQKRISAESLSAALEGYRQQGRVYLIGSAVAVNASAMPPTLSVSGDRVIFHYADLDVLSSSRLKTLRDVSLSVQIRHSPETLISESNLMNKEKRLEQNDPLQRWLEPIINDHQ